MEFLAGMTAGVACAAVAALGLDTMRRLRESYDNERLDKVEQSLRGLTSVHNAFVADVRAYRETEKAELRQLLAEAFKTQDEVAPPRDAHGRFESRHDRKEG